MEPTDKCLMLKPSREKVNEKNSAMLKCEIRFFYLFFFNGELNELKQFDINRKASKQVLVNVTMESKLTMCGKPSDMARDSRRNTEESLLSTKRQYPAYN